MALQNRIQGALLEIIKLFRKTDEFFMKIGSFLLNMGYVFLDARYENVRQAGIVRSCAVLLAIGVDESGQREVLGVSVELSEAELHWRNFLSSLKDRGLCGLKMFISDAHEGLRAARNAVFPSVPWQRCQFHLCQWSFETVPILVF